MLASVVTCRLHTDYPTRIVILSDRRESKDLSYVVTSLECALTLRDASKSFRFRSYAKLPGGVPRHFQKMRTKMELQTTNSNVVNESNPEDLPRCQKHTRNGRCRMLVADPTSPFCPEHTRSSSNFRRTADLSTLLTEGLTDFKSATPINDFLSRLLLHQAEGRIPPRRAAVMAYTCNLLLRTLPAIEREAAAPPECEPQRIIIDMPGPTRD